MKNPSEQIEEYVGAINKGIYEAFKVLEQSEVPDISLIESDIKLMLDTFQFLELDESFKYKSEVASIMEKMQSVRDGIAIVMHSVKDEMGEINKHSAAYESYSKAANDND